MVSAFNKLRKKYAEKKHPEASPKKEKYEKSRKQLLTRKNVGAVMEIHIYIFAGLSTAAWIICGTLSHLHYRYSPIWFGCLALCFLSISGAFWLVNRESQKSATTPTAAVLRPLDFSVIRKGGWLTPQKEATIFWMISSISSKPLLYPIATGIYIHLANLSESPLSISGYTVEGETAPGIWTPFPSLIIEGATFFTVDTFHFERAVDLDFSGELFDENIKNKTLNSGEVVKGWIFFEQWFKSSQLRFRIVDTRGVEKSAIMNEGSKMKIDFGYGSIRALGHKTDLSNLGFAPGVNVDLINANRPKK